MKPFHSLSRLISLLTGLLTVATISAQPLVWQNTIGGSDNEIMLSCVSTTDGGYIFAGYSNSPISADKSENNIGGNDMWIVKTDSVGNIEWDNTIGGTGDDVANSIVQTFDGGYIVAGYSNSGISGDKTAASKGDKDYWILKLTSTGSIEWQKTIGGNDNDQAMRIKQTPDLGYVIVGFSLSGISGDKTEANKGPAYTSDYWVVKLDNAGNLLWENTIGGDNYDYIYAVELTWDGGFIIGGYSQSGISGDKTEATMGGADYWVIKLNHLGNIQWQNTIGGTGAEIVRKIILDTDGGYVVAGYSTSDISGDKTENAFGVGSDYWVVKLNSAGSILWQNNIGGNDTEILYDMLKLPDGGFGLFGVSYSGVSGDKTEVNKGGSDYWYVKIDATGAIEEQNTIGGSSEDGAQAMAQGANLDIVLAGHSKSPAGADKAENNLGDPLTYDFWIATINNECIPFTEICNTVDDDCNGLIDDGLYDSISIVALGPTTICQGETVTLEATYSGTLVQWKRNGTSIAGATSSTYTTSQKGLYTCYTESDCGSAESDGINVVVNKKPSASITPGGPTSFCAGGNVTLSVTPVGGCSYQWYKGASLIAGATGLSYVATTPGNYKCKVTKIATGCFKNSNSIAVFVPCKEGEDLATNVLVYPNPASTSITINTPSFEEKNIVIFNEIGQQIININTSDDVTLIKTNTWVTGVYFIQVTDMQSTQILKLIIE